MLESSSMAEGEHQLIYQAVKKWLELAHRRELSEWENPEHSKQTLPANFVVALIKLVSETGQVTVDEFEPAVGSNYFGLYGLAGAMAVRARGLLESKGMPERSTALLIEAYGALEISNVKDVWSVERLITAVENSFPDGSGKNFAKPARRRLNRVRNSQGL